MKKLKRLKTRSHNSLLVVPPTNIKNKFSSESDIIVNSLINKIISLTISRSIKNRIEKDIPNKCFNYIEEFIKNKLLIEFLPHDTDDSQNNKNPNELSIYSNKFWPPNSSFQEEENSYIINKSKDIKDDNNSIFNIHQILYNNYNPGENDWNIMDEPKSNKYDSYSSTMVKFIEIEKQEAPINKKNKKDMKVNELEEVKEESFSKSNIKYNKKSENENDENKSNNNNNIQNEDNQINEKNDRNEINKNRKSNMTKRINIKIPNNQNNQNNQVKKKRNDIDINQFPYEDIENESHNYENNNDIDYDKLRKEIIQLEEGKLKEESKKNNIKNKSIDIKQIIGENTNKQYYGKNITVDPNGEIVLIKSIGLNKLKQDFIYAKTILKNIKQPKKIVKKIENKENKENNIEKKLENNKENNKENIIKKENENIENNELNKLKENNNITEYLKTSDKNILPKISQKKLNLSIKTDNINNNNNEIKKIRREPIYPSGSNFNLINMEIGVSIKEDEKFKTGGKDFFKKFNKYSKDIYNEKLKESIAANSFLNTNTQLFNEESNRFKTETNFENTYQGFNINQQEKDINSKYLMTSSNNFGGYNYLSNISNLIAPNNNNNNNLMTKTITQRMNQSNILNPSIKLSNISSLIGSLDKLNLINEGEEKFAKNNNNLFKNNKKKALKGLFLNKFNEMDEFTKEILKTGDWSNRGGNKSQGKSMYMYKKNPEKPSILEITRELGYKVKPIRNRSKIASSFINPAMKTVAFFKQ